MIEKVVYIVGAGFSAPAGLPVMSDFLSKSKDLYFQDTDRYSHFVSVFDMIRELSVTKNYYDAQLHNIEEILSILEMKAFLEGQKLKEETVNYIIDVIKHFTPTFKPYPQGLPSNWNDFIFGGNEIAENYGFFASQLLALTVQRARNTDKPLAYTQENPKAQYSVISLNYDLLLENCASFAYENYKAHIHIRFNTDDSVENWSVPPLLKLHGSVDSGVIVPPTWAKGNQTEIQDIWKRAYQVLEQANHIRFLGYSLPASDSYVSYLLKSAVVSSPHLKSIDVICLDPAGDVKARYDSFITFNNYRFVNRNIVEYFTLLRKSHPHPNVKQDMGALLNFDYLETFHEKFMSGEK